MPSSPIGTSQRLFLTFVALMTAAVLVLTVETQLFDSNFIFLSEAVSLLAGDHPYRDFFEWGAPLGAAVSAAMQLLAGYRLIGEFLLQWTLIVAGIVLSFRLGLRLCSSLAALAATFVITLPILAFTPTYHYPKLFLVPLILWVSWRYIEKPGVFGSIRFGIVAAIGFLFRHDYGIYAAAAFVVTLIAARLATPAARTSRSLARDVAACGLTTAVLIAPWALLIQTGEGLPEYLRTRAELFGQYQNGIFYWGLLQINPATTLSAWLTPDAGRDAALQAALWVLQVELVVPLLLAGSAALVIHRARYRFELVPIDAWLMIVAGVYMVVVNSFILRDEGYAAAVAPITAALGARFVAARHIVVRSAAIAVFAFTAVAAVVWTRDSPAYRPAELAASIPGAFEHLVASPPVSATTPLDGNPALSLQYLHDCTAPGDRILVMGSTPFQVPYYTRRPIAGGHLYWHQAWRADGAHEQQSLAMLMEQSVPFAFSTTEPILDDFTAYPRIREYLVANYAELPGSKGRLLFNRRRQPVRAYGPQAFPCFAPQ